MKFKLGYFFVFLVFILFVVFVKFYYFGIYQDYNQLLNFKNTIYEVNNGVLHISIFNEDEWKYARRLEYDENNRNIYIYVYTVSTLLRKDGLREKEIRLPQKGTYKIYYKNKGGSTIFLKEVSY